MVTPRDNTKQAAAAGEVMAEVKSCRASRVQAPEIAYRTYFCASSHLRRQCPAYGKVCKACNKPNHFARSRVCKKKAVSELKAEQSEEYHLFSVRNSSNEAPWRVSVKLNETDRRTSFKIRHGSRCVRHFFADLQHVTKASSTESSKSAV